MCMYVCMRVRAYVCMYVSIYINYLPNRSGPAESRADFGEFHSARACDFRHHR